MSTFKIASAAAAAIGLAYWLRRQQQERVVYTLHVYDHCPFCNRVEWLMGHFGLKYKRVLYGYGAGAKPEKCEGHGYGVGPVPLTGKKMLPVLEGPGVPREEGASGMPESMEICAFLIGQHRLVAPCESGRTDIKKYTADLTALKPELVEDRMVRMPILDWADTRDVHYRRWKKKLPLNPPPVVPQPEQVAALNAKLAELPALLKGRGCLNEWGWGIDDVMLLPQLRAFTVVKGAIFPPAVAAYMNIEGTQMVDYRAHAV